MPDTWSIFDWLSNPWAAEPDRMAALDQAELGGAPPPSLADVLTPPVPLTHPDDYSPAEWFTTLTRDWGRVPNLIPPAKHVLGSDYLKVLNFENKGRDETDKRTSLQCFHYAKYQMHLMDLSVSGPPALDTSSKLVLHEYGPKGDRRPEIQLREMVEAVWYLKSSLGKGIPLMMGVKIDRYAPEPNNIYKTSYVIPTDHYVVAVGMGVESGTSPYVSYYNYHHDYKDTDKLYLKKNLLMESDVTGYRLTEVRRSYPY